MNDLYTVWVGGVEVNDQYLNLEQATRIKCLWENDGYDDVLIEMIEKND